MLILLVDDDVRALGRRLTDHGVTWAMAGGLAIDLFLGRVTRPHADVDIAVWRADQERVRTALRDDWQLDVAEDRMLRPWLEGERLRLPIHEIHATRRGPRALAVEVLLNEHDGAEWVYRRDSAVRRGLNDAIGWRDGIPYLAPEIALLFKSKAPRPIDDADFDLALPAMSREQRSWLSSAIARANGNHGWLPRLAADTD